MYVCVLSNRTHLVVYNIYKAIYAKQKCIHHFDKITFLCVSRMRQTAAGSRGVCPHDFLFIPYTISALFHDWYKAFKSEASSFVVSGTDLFVFPFVHYRYFVDPALSLVMVCLIMKSTMPLLVDSALILLQTVPTHIQIDSLQVR